MIYKKKNIIIKFVNQRIKNGKKSKAEKILFKTFKECDNWIINQRLLQNKSNLNFPSSVSDLILGAVKNVQPIVEIRSVKVRGRKYQVPVPVERIRSQALAIKWIVYNSSLRNEKHIYLRLANELINSYEGLSKSTLKREQIHKLAESNRIFAHFRW
jgi:small subunit ribosomal protein S7